MAETAADRALEIGGRLAAPPSDRLRDSAFADELAGQRQLFRGLSSADIAHTITLAEQGVIPATPARQLIAALLELQQGEAAFVADAAGGDLYTNREAHLAGCCPAVGWLGVARARREALTTGYHLLLRASLLDLGDALIGFGRSVGRIAAAHRDAVMPDYTYLQAAQPTTFGHYLAGFAWPVLRDLQRLQGLHARVDLCPAGCGSTNGSVIFQDRSALARRLGFAAPVRHGRDAMWQADLAIETVGLAVAAVVGLDRLAEDLMIFATAEFGFVQLSDGHSRASKIMPQKRNPFALAYVRSNANRLIGIQAGIAAASRTPSGQMDNRLLAYEAVPEAVQTAARSAALIAEVVAGLRFDRARAAAALADRSACATDLAERLTLALGIDYRSAHRVVGRLIRRLDEAGRPLADLTGSELAAACREACPTAPPVPDGVLEAALDPWSCVLARGDLGGCAPDEVSRMADSLALSFAAEHRWIELARARAAAADASLLDEARRWAAGAP